jgi:hypothetical protein
MKKILPNIILLIVLLFNFQPLCFGINLAENHEQYLNRKKTNGFKRPLIIDQQQVDNLLRIQLVGGTGADEFVVYFDPTAQNGYNPQFDAAKNMADGAGIPNIYTYADTVKVSINVMQSMGQSLTIPVGLRAKIAGNYQINVLDLTSFAPTVGIFLEDIISGTIINLRSTNQHIVNLTVGEFNQRFKLHFYSGLNVEISNETCLQSDGKVTVTNPSSIIWNCSLMNLNGGIIGNSSLQNIVFNNLDEGTYRLRMDNGQGYLVEELINITGADPVYGSIQPLSSNSYFTTDVIEASADQPEANYQYSWYLNDLLAGTGSKISLNITSPGIYTLKLRINAANCEFETTTSFNVIQSATVGIETNESASGFIIYPNPARDVLNIQINRKIGFNMLTVYDASGRLVHQEKLSSAQGQQAVQLPLNDLNPGIYQVILEGNNSRSTAKFTKLR